MTADSPPSGNPVDHPSLCGLLASRARRSSDGRLAVDAAAGTVLVAAILLARPSLWLLARGAAVVAAFGAWGIADRELAERATGRLARGGWAVARAAAAMLGLMAGALFLLGLMTLLLGNWIS